VTFPEGFSLQNSCKVFEETSKEFFCGIFSYSFVTEITDWVVCLVNLALLVTLSFLDCNGRKEIQAYRAVAQPQKSET
jgi:hypothetical protein